MRARRFLCRQRPGAEEQQQGSPPPSPFLSLQPLTASGMKGELESLGLLLNFLKSAPSRLSPENELSNET